MNLVVGATGSLGGTIARRLMERGDNVRILARTHSDYGPLERDGAQVVFGDLKDPDSLTAALRGIRNVITTANSAARGGDDNTESVDRRGTASLIDAAAEAGVERFLYLSTTAAALDSPVPFFRAKAENEQRLAESGLTYTILRPALFMEVWIGAFLETQLAKGPKVQIIGEGRKRAAFVSAGDVATLAVNALRHPRARDATIVLSAAVAGYREIINAIALRTGSLIEIESLEPGQMLDRLPPPQQATMTGLMTGLALGPETDFTTPEVAETYGLRLTTLDAYLETTFGDRIAAN